MRSLLSMVFSRGLWNFFGLVALSLLIWIAGPLLAIGAVRPLESEFSRAVTIAVLFLIWLARIIWRKWREGRLNAQLLGQLRRPAKPSNKADAKPVNEEVQALGARFDEAVSLLRKTRFEASGRPHWMARFSKQYLYQLPWYVFIGAPGSGKTTALVNAGLNFPLADRFGKVALRGVGGTRNCDWWFTDEAVLLDTAGRYTTHESDPTGDEQEWKGFLGLLTRFRGRQPINGAILTISVADLLSANDAERARHAAVLRRRLQDLREQLGIQFPIYVLVTKVDLLSGFEEYFGNFSRDDLAQVWGFTFPFARTQEAGFDLHDSFTSEYDLLHARLNEALPDVLAEQADPDRRALAYLLPQQFAGMKAMLGHFLTDVFASSRFEADLCPRGVYFTSGAQVGEPFDQVTGRLRRFLRISPNGPAAPADGSQQQETGRSYFLKNLLQDVIFKESGLAGRNHRWEARYRRLHWAGYTVAVVLLVALVAGWLNSYRNNSRYIDEVAARVPPVAQQGRDIKITAAGDVLGLMPFLDSLWALPRSERFDLDAPPWSYRLGLYQGEKLQAAAQGIYRNTLEQVLLPQVARRVETALRRAPENDLEYSYEALRAYLMLHDASRYDGGFMHAWLLADMQTALAPGYTRQDYDNLSRHLHALTDGRVVASPFPQDEELVRQARERLAGHSLAARAYSRLKRILASEDLEASTVVSLAGPQAASVFVRTSGKPLTDGISGLYSYRGYWDVFSKRIDPVSAQLRRDDVWVLGVANPPALDSAGQAQLQNDIRRMYLNDYVQQWDAYLADIKLVTSQSLLKNIQVARTLSAPDSPMVRLVRGVAQQTTLVRESGKDERSLVDQARERVDGTRGALEQMFGTARPGATQRGDLSEGRLELIVDRHFEPYHRLATSENGSPPPISATTALIDELYTYLTAADAALRTASPAPDGAIVSKLRAESGRLPALLREVLDSLSAGAMGEVSTIQRNNLGEQIDASIGVFCRQAIAGRYPFARGSNRDVAPGDMARMFAPGGMMDTFFQQHLVGHLDMSGTRWRFKPGIAGEEGASPAFLVAFQRAAVIRDAFFGVDSKPTFSVMVRPVEMDAEISQMVLDVDGTPVRYAHGPQMGTAVTWPGPRAGNQVRLDATPQTGSGLSTSGPWALHRMLDRATTTRGSTAENMLATFDLGGRKVTLEVSAMSVKNPLRLPEMQGFSCPGRS
ncbi:MAG: type VI secretion system membrane subunit TssM [Burkholderiaceae bacterium]